ncbi:hypothetical protein J0J37_22545, partial [Vibrio vulnificus]|uniref:hypothetical protein n=1 Tax=Vibrio vulnificus TaxID=672 RepID=UPI0019D49D1C
EFEEEKPLLNKLDHVKNKMNLKIPNCERCMKIGHGASTCYSPRRVILIKKIWVPKGTKVMNCIFMANKKGPNLVWVPINRI